MQFEQVFGAAEGAERIIRLPPARPGRPVMSGEWHGRTFAGRGECPAQYSHRPSPAVIAGSRICRQMAGWSASGGRVPRAGAPDRIRTCDLPLRRRTLYPAELPGLGRDAGASRVGGADGGRTHDLSIANAALSQLSYGPGEGGKFTRVQYHAPPSHTRTHPSLRPAGSGNTSAQAAERPSGTAACGTGACSDRTAQHPDCAGRTARGAAADPIVHRFTAAGAEMAESVRLEGQGAQPGFGCRAVSTASTISRHRSPTTDVRDPLPRLAVTPVFAGPRHAATPHAA